MPHYHRYRVPVGTYFFTLTRLERRLDLLIWYIAALREAVRRTRAERPFHIDGWVVLPDHLHCVLTLPSGDTAFSNRLKAKIRFVQAVPSHEWYSAVRVARGERSLWQHRFWELPSGVKRTMHATRLYAQQPGQTRPGGGGGPLAVFDVS